MGKNFFRTFSFQEKKLTVQCGAGEREEDAQLPTMWLVQMEKKIQPDGGSSEERVIHSGSSGSFL